MTDYHELFNNFQKISEMYFFQSHVYYSTLNSIPAFL